MTRDATTDSRTRKELRLLKLYALGSTVLLGTLSLAAFSLAAFSRAAEKPRFTEIDVERINVVEKGGRVRLVISNTARSPDPVIGGRTFPRSSGKEAGLIFFNEEGDEDGGLAWHGETRDGHTRAGGGLLFDQYHQDQTVGITYDETDGRRSAGLRVWDRSDTPIVQLYDRMIAVRNMPAGAEKDRAMQGLRAEGAIGAQRVFVGKNAEKIATVNLADAMGRPRLRLVVDSAGAARIEFLDENGRVTRALADSGGQ